MVTWTGQHIDKAVLTRTGSGAGSGGSAGLRALVVEDDDSVRKLCEQTLSDAGYEVLVASDAEEAEAIVASSGGVNLVVSDLAMPAAAARGSFLGSGLAFPPRIRRDGVDTPYLFDATAPVLLISGHDPADLGIDTDEVAFLAKPFAPEQLVEAARAALGTEPGLPTGGARRSSGDTGGAQIGVNRGKGRGITIWDYERSKADPGDSGDDPQDGGRRRNRFLDHLMGVVGFGSFTVKKRLAVVVVTAGLVVLAVAGVVMARGGGGDVESMADDGRESDVGGEDATTDSDDTPQPAGEGSTQSQFADDAETATDDQQAGGPLEPEPQAEPEPDPEPEVATVAYEPPTMGEPVLSDCTASRAADGTTEYAVTYTIESTGGAYDVLAGEPFVGNDDTVEVRGGTLTWTVATTHAREHGDEADTFFVSAPSVLGWAEPGGADRQHTHQPSPLEVHADECPAG